MSDRPPGLPGKYYPPDLEPVPTADQLVDDGLATREYDARRKATIYRISEAGYARIAEVMVRNAEKAKAWASKN